MRDSIRSLRTAMLIMLAGTLVANANVPAQDVRPVVLYLHTEFRPYKNPGEDSSSTRLTRELARQAVLVAAREELGVFTRDETLQEEDVLPAQLLHVMPFERGNAAGQWRFRLVSLDEGTRWNTEFTFQPQGIARYREMVTQLELASRGTLIEGLSSMGVVRQTRAAGDPVAVPAEVEAWLAQPDCLTQFAALRAAHAAIAAHGESSAWLGVLVRGYAHLAVLTRHFWNSVPEVCTARAWLYAQRLAVRTDSDEGALCHRMAAWAYGGLLPLAVEEGNALALRRGWNAPCFAQVLACQEYPAWARLAWAYAHCDRQAMQELADAHAELKPWELILRYTLDSFECDEPRLVRDARDAAVLCPQAFMLFDELSSYGNYYRLQIPEAPQAVWRFPNYVRTGVARLPGLPAELAASAEQASEVQIPENQVELTERLLDAYSPVPQAIARQLRDASQDDRAGELTWSVLAYWLEEEQYLQVLQCIMQRRTRSHNALTVEVDRMLPLIRDHRYAGYLEGFRYDFLLEGKQTRNVWKTVKFDDPRAHMVNMLLSLRGIPEADGSDRAEVAFQAATGDLTLHGVTEVLASVVALQNNGNAIPSLPLLQQVASVAPQSDRGLEVAILTAASPSPEQLAEWEGQLRSSPSAWAELASRYVDQRNMESAIRCAQRSLSLSSNALAASVLAEAYQLQGDSERWEQTLREELERVQLEVDRDELHLLLANGLASRALWRRALPHAKICAEDGSQLGLYIAAQVTEALAQWTESEAYVRQLSERYPLHFATQWYFWCARTGRGDIAEAQLLADRLLSVGVRATAAEAAEDGVYQLVRGSRRLGFQAFRRAWSMAPTYRNGFLVAQLARVTGDEPVRAEVLAALQEYVREPVPLDESAEAARAAAAAVLEFLQTKDTDDAAAFAKLDAVVRAADMTTRGECALMIGQELAARGRLADAEIYWRRALANPGNNAAHSTLAGWELSNRQITSREQSEAWPEGETWPNAASSNGP